MTKGVKNAPKAEDAEAAGREGRRAKPVEDPRQGRREAGDQGRARPTAAAAAEPKPSRSRKGRGRSRRTPEAAEARSDRRSAQEGRAPSRSRRRGEAKAATPQQKPPKQQPKFDPTKIAALLDKREPQRQAAAGDALNDDAALGCADGHAAQLSQSEIDALRARLSNAGTRRPAPRSRRTHGQCSHRAVQAGRLAGRRAVLTSGGSRSARPAARDSAMRAVFTASRSTCCRPEHYEQWKDIEITFDPRDMFGG